MTSSNFKFGVQRSCTFPSKGMMKKNFASEKRTKIVFKELLGNLAIRFNVIIMSREKRVKKAQGQLCFS